MSVMLPHALSSTPDPSYDSALSCWRALGGTSIPVLELASRLRSWDDQVYSSQYDTLVAAASGPAP